MKSLNYGVAILLLAGLEIRADQQTTEAGKQRITARRTTKPVVIDGAFSPGEWSAAIPTHVNAVKPGEAPGLVPYFINSPKNQDDSSFTIRALYDDNYLYIAVDVADNEVISDNPELPFLDDDVEIYLNGDKQPFDLDAINGIPDWFGVQPNNEGYQLVTSAGNTRAVYPYRVQVSWDSKAAVRPRGFLVETRISLDSINTIDNSWFTPGSNLTPPDFAGDSTQSDPPGATFAPIFRRPQPGDSIGFNVTVSDDDNGRQPGNPNPWEDGYARTDLVPNPSSYTAWDGSSLNWYYADESAWGTLYLAP